MQAAQQANSSSGQLQVVILDLSPVAHIDVSAVYTLEDLLKDYKKR